MCTPTAPSIGSIQIIMNRFRDLDRGRDYNRFQILQQYVQKLWLRSHDLRHAARYLAVAKSIENRRWRVGA